jgi:hypothetical protein
MGLIPTYMIVIKDNPISEYYASVTIPRWEECGYEIEIFDAITPLSTVSFELVFNSFSEALKYRLLDIKKKITPTEKAVWYSHVSLWLKCIELNQNIMVLEHDCYLTNPENITMLKTADFVCYDKGAMGCYVISPRFASHMCRELISEKRAITTGPLGYVNILISELTFEESNIYNTVFHHSPNYKIASNQIYNHDYKTTISHFINTEVEEHLDKLNQFEFILAETNKPIDITKTVRIRTE